MPYLYDGDCIDLTGENGRSDSEDEGVCLESTSSSSPQVERCLTPVPIAQVSKLRNPSTTTKQFIIPADTNSIKIAISPTQSTSSNNAADKTKKKSFVDTIKSMNLSKPTDLTLPKLTPIKPSVLSNPVRLVSSEKAKSGDQVFKIPAPLPRAKKVANKAVAIAPKPTPDKSEAIKQSPTKVNAVTAADNHCLVRKCAKTNQTSPKVNVVNQVVVKTAAASPPPLVKGQTILTPISSKNSQLAKPKSPVAGRKILLGPVFQKVGDKSGSSPGTSPVYYLIDSVQESRSSSPGSIQVISTGSSINEKIEIVDEELRAETIDDDFPRIESVHTVLESPEPGMPQITSVETVLEEAPVVEETTVYIVPDDDGETAMAPPGVVTPVDISKILGESPVKELELDQTCHSVVTPVDIAKILGEAPAQKPEPRLEERCNSGQLRKLSLYSKGFTKRESKRPCCLRIMQAQIKIDTVRIQELKKSVVALTPRYVNCGETSNNFLPETEEIDPMLKQMEDQLSRKIYNSDTFPIIADVVSQVNKEMRLMKDRGNPNNKDLDQDLRSKLAKPEAALMLIQAGLEMIKSWSVESHQRNQPSTAASTSPHRRQTREINKIEDKTDAVRRRASEVKRRVEEAAAETAQKRVVKKTDKAKEEEARKEVYRRRRTKKDSPVEATTNESSMAKQKDDNVVRNRKRSVESVDEVKEPVKRRRRRRKKKVEDDEVDEHEVAGDKIEDNELFVVKKVDILSDSKNKNRRSH